ncbi:hypothetical protein TNIN_143921, partial [Trichonephila inaurata madagascariensis]
MMRVTRASLSLEQWITGPTRPQFPMASFVLVEVDLRPERRILDRSFIFSS